MKAPIIVCGLRDSWVAQTAMLLAQHPQQCFVPELNLFLSDTIETHQLLCQHSQDGLGDGLLRCIAHWYFDGDDEPGLAAATDWLWRRSAWPCRELLRQLATDSDKQLVIPDRMLGWRPDYLARLLTLDDFMLIHLTRHPIEHGLELVCKLAQESFIAPEWKNHHLAPEGQLDPQIAWLRFHRSLHQKMKDDPRYIHLRCEDLQRQPQSTLSLLAEQLGWRQQGLSPNRHAETCFLQPGHSQAPMGMEKSAMLQPRLVQDTRTPGPLDSPAEWLPENGTLHPDVSAFARTLGYQ